MSIIEHLIENYIHAMAQGKKPEEIADMYKDQLEDTGMSPENTWAIAQHVVYSLYDGFFPDFPDLPLTVRHMGKDVREIVYCKDCRKHNHHVEEFPTDESCPLIFFRGMAQGHEFDYQYCVCGKRREHDCNDNE